MKAITQYLEGAFALLVTGAALSPWPWTALIVAGAFLVGLAVTADRRMPEPEPAK